MIASDTGRGFEGVRSLVTFPNTGGGDGVALVVRSDWWAWGVKRIGDVEGTLEDDGPWNLCFAY